LHSAAVTHANSALTDHDTAKSIGEHTLFLTARDHRTVIRASKTLG
jgi:hypothetical protein